MIISVYRYNIRKDTFFLMRIICLKEVKKRVLLPNKRVGVVLGRVEDVLLLRDL